MAAVEGSPLTPALAGQPASETTTETHHFQASTISSSAVVGEIQSDVMVNNGTLPQEAATGPEITEVSVAPEGLAAPQPAADDSLPRADPGAGAVDNSKAEKTVPDASQPAAGEQPSDQIAVGGQKAEQPVADAAATLSSTAGKTAGGTKVLAGKTFKRIGTELVTQVRLPKWQLEETADRLSKPKERISVTKTRPKAVQLKYEFDKSLRGGKGGYKEIFAPAKKASAEEKQEYMVALAERCKESRVKMKEALKEKYLQPLQPNAKKIPAEEMDQHLAKMDNLYHGKGISG